MLAIVLFVVLGVLHASDQVNVTATVGCCDMGPTDICAWIVTYPWKSSMSGPPITTDYPGFAYVDPYYLYLQDSAGGIMDSSAAISIANQYTIISLDYYFSTPNPSPDSYLNIYFVPQSYPNRVLISDTNIPVDNWIHKDIPCNDKNNYCCGTLGNFPCLGTIEVVGSLGVAPPTGLMAVDNIGTCVTPPKACCKFDDSATCDFTNVPGNTQDWFWSHSSPPPLLPPLPTPTLSEYVYFEVINFPTGTTVDSTFRSARVTIPENVDFSGDFYIDTPYGNAGDSGLKIDFVDSNTGKRSEMAYFRTTFGGWQTLSFSCSTAVNNCCNGFTTCSGWLEFVAHVDYPGGTALYAVDLFSESGTPCP